MKREEAQFILGAFRPDSEDLHDPQFQEALALVREDPVLARWFADEQAIDRAFAAKIRAHPTPSDLKAQLLLARTTAPSASHWRRPLWLAVAASVALLLTVAGSLQQRRARETAFAGFRSAMADTSLDMSNHVDVMGLDADGYKHWLVEHRGDPDFVLPPALAAKGIAACKVISWEKRPATMLCIKFSGQHVDVFVFNAVDFPDFNLKSSPAFFADGRVNTAVWKNEGKVYLLAGTMSKAELQQLF